MKNLDLDAIADAFGALALSAGSAVMAVYARGGAIRYKADSSPVSDADEAAEAIILTGLAELVPDIPVIAEEAVARGHVPGIGDRFILVDPLDGTREFINRNGEFTINIALIQAGVPIVGAVYAPVLNRLWLGGCGASMCTSLPGEKMPPRDSRRKIHARRPPESGLIALTSRSHGDAETAAYLAKLAIAECKSAGSSLKFCLIAEGEADIYPRFGPTMEWDTAAGDAVLRAAGGRVLDCDGAPLIYGKSGQSFRNGAFFAWGAENSGQKRTGG